MPRWMQSSMVRQILSRPSRISSSSRHCLSRSSIASEIEMPRSSQTRSSSAPVVKMVRPSSSAATSAIERSMSASSTTKPPPTENIGRRTSSAPPAAWAMKVIPLECCGRKVNGCSTIEEGRSDTSSRPSSSSPPSASIRSTRSLPATGSTVSGSEPSRPITIAERVPCPSPVAASEPYRWTSTSATWGPVSGSASTSCANCAAARIGPTVWELDGPMPILNMSNVLMLTAVLLDVLVVSVVPAAHAGGHCVP